MGDFLHIVHIVGYKKVKNPAALRPQGIFDGIKSSAAYFAGGRNRIFAAVQEVHDDLSIAFHTLGTAYEKGGSVYRGVQRGGDHVGGEIVFRRVYAVHAAAAEDKSLLLGHGLACVGVLLVGADEDGVNARCLVDQRGAFFVIRGGVAAAYDSETVSLAVNAADSVRAAAHIVGAEEEAGAHAVIVQKLEIGISGQPHKREEQLGVFVADALLGRGRRCGCGRGRGSRSHHGILGLVGIINLTKLRLNGLSKHGVGEYGAAVPDSEKSAVVGADGAVREGPEEGTDVTQRYIYASADHQAGEGVLVVVAVIGESGVNLEEKLGGATVYVGGVVG